MSFNLIQAFNNLSAVEGGAITAPNLIAAVDELVAVSALDLVQLNLISVALGGPGGFTTNLAALTNIASLVSGFSPAGGITASTYLPVATNLVNMTSVSPFTAQFIHVGKIVHVSGLFFAQGTAPGAATFDISIPITSAFVAVENANGVYITKPTEFTIDNCVAVVGTSTVRFFLDVVAGGPRGISYSFTYRILP